MGHKKETSNGGATPVENPFLKQLLALQQDGSAAISSPRTWGTSPLLHVETDLDKIVEGLVSAIQKGQADRKVALWQFFVGSPGNGKSAGTGELARKLVGLGYLVQDKNGRDLSQLSPDEIPYELHVFENGARYHCAVIAQDASVVPDPYAEDANPATSLVELLKGASNKGLALVLCTNRGVLERAFAAHYLNAAENGTTWFSAIRAAVEGKGSFSKPFDDGGRGKKVFESVNFSFVNLDKRSLLVGRDTFEQLVVKAVDSSNWSACDACPARPVCPYFQNSVWMRDAELRKAFLAVVREAEVLSGQVIVFREALALLSLVLSGCPHDYPDGSPCAWVQERQRTGEYFSLLSRRLYMTVFSSYAPFGLETHDADRDAERRVLAQLATATGPDRQACENALRPVVFQKPSLSSDVGVVRLVGIEGIFREVDPFSDILPSDFHDRWDDEGRHPFELGERWVSDLEKACSKIWQSLKVAAEISSDTSGETYKWLSRWITSFTHRAGAIVEQRYTFAAEVTQLVGFLSLGDEIGDEDYKLIEQLEEALAGILQAENQGIQISPYASLRGAWVNQKLSPRLLRESGADRGAIVPMLKIGEATRIPLSAFAFSWLKRRIDRGMSTKCFPHEYLDSAGDAQVRAASESKYHVANDDVEIVLTNGKAVLKRRDGRVIVDGT